MIRPRPAGLLVGLVGLVVLSGCATFEDTDAVAVVEGTALPREDYEQFLQLYTDNSDLTGVSADPATGTVSGDDGRARLTELVLTMATKEFLAANGESVTDEERAAALAELEEGNPILDAPKGVQEDLVDGSLVQTATARIPAPDAATLEQRYAESPSSVGALCARHILVATEAEAEAVMEELERGAEFAELAAERSMDPAAADTGGVLAGQDGSECLPLASVAGAGPSFARAAFEAEVGVPAGPVASGAGWHVLLVRPYEEIAESLGALYETQAGQLLLGAYLPTLDISVDPRYGRWDRYANTVVPL